MKICTEREKNRIHPRLFSLRKKNPGDETLGKKKIYVQLTARRHLQKFVESVDTVCVSDSRINPGVATRACRKVEHGGNEHGPTLQKTKNMNKNTWRKRERERRAKGMKKEDTIVLKVWTIN